MIRELRPGQELIFDYRDSLGVPHTRRVRYETLRYGTIEEESWPYDQPLWFLHGWDLNLEEPRSFMLDRIIPTNILFLKGHS